MVRRQVEPGVGAEFLATIGARSRQFNAYIGMDIHTKAHMDTVAEQGEDIRRGVLTYGLNDDSWLDFEKQFTELSEIEIDTLARLALIHNNDRHFQEIRESKQLRVQQLMHLRVKKTGVYFKKTSKISGPAVPFDFTEGAAQIEPETDIHRKFKVLETLPTLGGLAIFETPFSMTHIYGLVNPATGEPLVSLELYS